MSSRTVEQQVGASGQNTVKNTAATPELYTYDPTSGDNTVKVGIRDEGSGTGGSAGDWKIRNGGEKLTGSGQEVSTGFTNSTVHVGWDRSTDTITVALNPSEAQGDQMVYMGSVQSASDDGSGTSTGPADPE